MPDLDRIAREPAVRRPPLWWTLLSYTAIGAMLVAVWVVAARMVVIVDMGRDFSAGQPFAVGVTRLGRLNRVSDVVFFGGALVCIVLVVATRSLRRRHGLPIATQSQLGRFRGLVYTLVLVALVYYSWSVPRDNAQALTTWTAVQFGLGVVAVVSVVTHSLRFRRAFVPALPVPGPPVRADDRARVGSGPDRFWAEVESLWAAKASAVALLETWVSGTRRWHIIDDVADLVAARERIVALSTLTAYVAAPRPPSDQVVDRFVKQAATESTVYLGLIEEPGEHAVRFQRLETVEDLTAWARRARRATRCGIYPEDPSRAAGSLTTTLTSR